MIIGRDVQETLDQDTASVGEALLEFVDRVIPALDFRNVGEVTYAADQHVFIVRSVKDANHSWPWQCLLDPPEEVVL